MKDNTLLEVEIREPGSTNAAKRLRAAGKIPAVLYGGGRDPRTIAVNPRSVIEILRAEGGQNTILSLKVGDGRKQTALIHDYQVDPISRRLLHADFRRISMDVAVEVAVPIELTGEPVGVKIERGILDVIIREVHVRCLPGDIPDHLFVDVSELEIGDAVHISDLGVPEAVEILDDLEQTVATVAPPAVEVEEEVEEEEELIGEAEEPAVVGADDEEEGQE